MCIVRIEGYVGLYDIVQTELHRYTSFHTQYTCTDRLNPNSLALLLFLEPCETNIPVQTATVRGWKALTRIINSNHKQGEIQ